MTDVVRFGAWTYSLDGIGHLPPLLQPFRVEETGAIAVFLDRSPAPLPDRPQLPEIANGALLGPNFTARSTAAEFMSVHATLHGGSPALQDSALVTLLSALVVWRAARDGLFALHCSGLHVGPHDDVALFAGASGTGKSTLARRGGRRAFAYNAALIDPTNSVAWPLPFTGRADPPLGSAQPRSVVLWATVEHGSEFHLEWQSAAHATQAIVPHVAIIRADPACIDSVTAAMRFARSVPSAAIRFAVDDDVAARVDTRLREDKLPR